MILLFRWVKQNILLLLVQHSLVSVFFLFFFLRLLSPLAVRSKTVNHLHYSMLTGILFSLQLEIPEPSKIRESMKALARSVHDETMFGELPRPRRSTYSFR